MMRKVGFEPWEKGFDYQRKAGGRTPVSKANERQCNSSEAQSNPCLSAILIKKTPDCGVFFRIRRKHGYCRQLTLAK